MIIACFHIEPWQKKILEEKLQGHTLKIFSESLRPDNLDQAKDADILVSRARFIHLELNRETLEKLPNLKCITTMSTGFDHIDLEACKERNIAVSNVPDYGSNTVAEQTLALILAASRKIYDAIASTKAGSFDCTDVEGFDLKDKTLGVIGSGKIGLEVIKRAKAFDMNIIAFDVVHNNDAAQQIGFSYVELDELIEKSDIITLHAPYNKHTHHMLNSDNMTKLKKGVTIINTARGGLIDTYALLFLLENKTIAAAALDVIEGEKDEVSLDKQPETIQKLVQMGNVYITPHNASNTREARTRILNTTIENIEAFDKGTPKNLVTQ